MELVMIWGPGSFIGLVVGVIVCAVFAFVAIKIAKKDGMKLDEILATLSDAEKNEIMNQTYTKAEGKDQFVTNAFIASITNEAEKVKLVIMFYMQEHQSYYTRNVKMTAADLAAKGYTAHTFVPALMKYDREMHYYDFKKLL